VWVEKDVKYCNYNGLKGVQNVHLPINYNRIFICLSKGFLVLYIIVYRFFYDYIS